MPTVGELLPTNSKVIEKTIETGPKGDGVVGTRKTWICESSLVVRRLMRLKKMSGIRADKSGLHWDQVSSLGGEGAIVTDLGIFWINP